MELETILNYILDYVPRLWLIWIFPLLYFVARVGWRVWKWKQLRDSGIKEIDRMEGFEFERYLCWLFGELGHRVENVGDTGDFGADLLTRYQGEKYVIQAKRYRGNVGVEAVQQTVGARGFYATDKAMVVTNSFYTPAAKKLAHANDIELWDRDRLIAEIHRIK